MSPMPTGKVESSVTTRLQVLAQGRSQSELARLTGTSVANVNRYLRGRRVPAEFCAALVRGLGVNPAWLLTGDGAPFVADVATGTAKMAGDVLELVEAMNAVSQVRLGALAGKHHMRVLRELNDALLRHEDLRQRLNKQSAPIFLRLLDDLEKVLSGYNVERATDLLKACEQVERLCDEPALSGRLTRLQAHFASITQNPTRAAVFLQKIMRDRVVEAGLAEPADCEPFLRLAVTLSELGRNGEALRVCDAFKGLAGEEIAGWELYHQLEFLRGSLLAEMGSLYPGLALMQQHLSGTTGKRGEVSRRVQMRAQLYAGLMTLDEALHYGPDIPGKAIYLLEIAAWQQQPDQLKRVMDFARLHMSLMLRRDDGVRFAEATELSLGGGAGLDQYLKAVGDFANDPAHQPIHHIRACTLALLEKDRRTALKLFRQVEAAFKDSRAEAQARVYFRALHYRNARRLGLEKDRADAFFATIAAAGYVCFTNALSARSEATG